MRYLARTSRGSGGCSMHVGGVHVTDVGEHEQN